MGGNSDVERGERGEWGYTVDQPPSTGTTAPVIQEASSDARNSATLATSVGDPSRPSGGVY